MIFSMYVAGFIATGCLLLEWAQDNPFSPQAWVFLLLWPVAVPLLFTYCLYLWLLANLQE